MQSFSDFMSKRSQREPKSHDDNVMIIDGNNFFIRCFSNFPTVDNDGRHVGGLIGFLMSLAKVVRENQPTKVIVVFDGSEGSKKRKKIMVDYKSNRSESKKALEGNRYEELRGLEDPDESFQWQMDMLKTYLKMFPVTVISYKNAEADDVIAYCTTLFNKKKLIVSADKDFCQLVNENVSILDPIQKKIFGIEEVFSKFNGVSPEMLALARSIDGDTGDALKGINGIGLKTLVKWLPDLFAERRYMNSYEFMAFVDDALKEALPKNPYTKFLQKIKDSEKLLHDSFSVTDLHSQSMISSTTKDYIREDLKKPNTPIDIMTFKKCLMRDGLNAALKDPMTLTSVFSTLNSFAKQDRQESK
jgi:5'-3' exonuclease